MPKYGMIAERSNQLHEMIRLSGMNVIIDDTDHPLIIKVATLQQAHFQVYFIYNEDYFASNGSVDDLIRIAETEVHRDANESALATAKKAGATRKTWVTMMDEKVRDTHQYLEMMTVGINEDFYTYDGDHASAPGLFDLAENNVNCRCELVFS